MSTSKHIDIICIAAVCLTLVLSILFMCGGNLGISAAARAMKYESTLFDTSFVHKIDIVMDDWDSFIENCENEEYSSCTVVIDGEQYKNTAIRAKGNTSLSSVRSLGSQRYSFKLEFDHYENGKSCDGLDKLCLNNLIQDNTMMKDYIVYQLMNDFGVASPLCSFVYITVNGEDWGLYLAVEGIEDSFLSRNYGSDAGVLYKPDSMSFGGGRGNGKDFNMDDFDFEGLGEENAETDFKGPESNMPQMTMDFGRPGGDMPQMPGGFGGMGSDDVKLKYIDDDPDSYPNIFDSAKTDISSTDQDRLISALKKLSEYSDLENTLEMEEVLRYFVVHNFVCNGDSYTGSMIHNYYLHEKDGKLGMIPWDYNLAFGTFQGGNASGTVNASVDNPVSGGSMDDRPMVGWIFSDEEYTAQYHELFSEFILKWFSNGELVSMISDTAEMLSPYVEKDPTKFCSTEEFNEAVDVLTGFVTLRAEAVRRQLSGDVTLVETGDLNLSDMGSMGGGFGGGKSRLQSGNKFSQEDFNASGNNKNEQPFGVPTDGNRPKEKNSPDNSFNNSFNGQKDNWDPPGPGGNRKFEPYDGTAFDNQTEAAEKRTWRLVGISGVVLAAGLLIARKKKY